MYSLASLPKQKHCQLIIKAIDVTAPFLINTHKTHVWRHGGPQPCGCCQLSDSHMHGLFKPHLSAQPWGLRTRVLVGLILLSEASLISLALRAAQQDVPDRTRYWQTWSLHEAKQSPEAWGKSLRRLTVTAKNGRVWSQFNEKTQNHLPL